jgi:hypothetical protein
MTQTSSITAALVVLGMLSHHRGAAQIGTWTTTHLHHHHFPHARHRGRQPCPQCRQEPALQRPFEVEARHRHRHLQPDPPRLRCGAGNPPHAARRAAQSTNAGRSLLHAGKHAGPDLGQVQRQGLQHRVGGRAVGDEDGALDLPRSVVVS